VETEIFTPKDDRPIKVEMNITKVQDQYLLIDATFDPPNFSLVTPFKGLLLYLWLVGQKGWPFTHRYKFAGQKVAVQCVLEFNSHKQNCMAPPHNSVCVGWRSANQPLKGHLCGYLRGMAVNPCILSDSSPVSQWIQGGKKCFTKPMHQQLLKLILVWVRWKMRTIL